MKNYNFFALFCCEARRKGLEHERSTLITIDQNKVYIQSEQQRL